MRALGVQVVADLYECDPAALDDVALVREAMRGAAQRAGATIVTDCFHRFEPHGVRGAVVIAESHLAIHTWPEHGYAAVDLFPCGADLRPDAGLTHLAKVLGSRRHHERKVLRGHAPELARVPPHRLASRPITILDGSLGGADGNTMAVLAPLVARLRAATEVRVVHLAAAELPDEELARLLHESAGFVFATGTYWDSWGSPLQRFLERATRFEGGPAWLGKPAAVVVTMHSVGGKGVLSRLQGVLSTLGCQIPPMSGMVYSLATHLAIRSTLSDPSVPYADFWQIDDFDTLCHNLLEAASGGGDFRAWSRDGGDAGRRWATGIASEEGAYPTE